MRVVLLLSILFVIVIGTWMTEKRMASWERPILVTVYPINADNDSATARFVSELDVGDFNEINRFFEREAQSCRPPCRASSTGCGLPCGA